MAVPATEFEVEYSMDVDARLARVEERTDHIQRDVTEIKSDIRRLDSKVDALNEKVGALAEKFGTMQIRMMMWSLGTVITVAGLAFGFAKFIK